MRVMSVSMLGYRYENTERREMAAAEKGLLYMGMGVSGGEEGARNGPSLMPGAPSLLHHNCFHPIC